MKAKDIALILVVVVLVAFTPNSPISVLARDVLADARPAPLLAGPVGTAFTYQGELTDGGVPADGFYDFQFKLWDAETSGGQIGSLVTRGDIVVAGGIFAVELDFGAGAFAGEARWLEIGVRPGASSDSYTTLDPRQKITPTPYALYATNVDMLDGQHGSAFATSAHNHWGQAWSGTGDGLTVSSSNANGLVGRSTASSGLTYGVYGTSSSTSGNGVVGWVNSATGSTDGVVGRSDSPSGIGVKGYTTATTGGQGVYGESQATSGGTGVYGVAQATTGGAAGVTGISHATDGGTGIYGVGASGTGNVYGVYGWSQSTGGTGVNGYATAGSGTTYGVQGRSDSPAGWGGAFSSNGNGVSAAAPASGILYQGVQAPSGAVKFSVSGAGDVSSSGKITGTSLDINGAAETGDLDVLGHLDVTNSASFDRTVWAEETITANGGIHVIGNLRLEGGYADGFFPRPTYDSGWYDMPFSGDVSFTHNIGQPPENYLVDLTCKEDDGRIMTSWGGPASVRWDSLGSVSVVVSRLVLDTGCDYVRVRIWLIN